MLIGPGLGDKKETLRCRRLADSQYRHYLTEALADPSLWQLGGYVSAQDYARKRRFGIYSICITQADL